MSRAMEFNCDVEKSEDMKLLLTKRGGLLDDLGRRGINVSELLMFYFYIYTEGFELKLHFI